MTFEDVSPFLFTAGGAVDNDSHNYVTNTIQGTTENEGQLDVHSSWLTLYGEIFMISKWAYF